MYKDSYRKEEKRMGGEKEKREKEEEKKIPTAYCIKIGFPLRLCLLIEIWLSASYYDCLVE